MAANESMYRKVALERLSSPEDLDALLRIADSRAWFAMIALFLLLFAASIWTFTGTVVSTASGVGVIAKGGGVFNIVAGATGFVVTVNAKAGDSVHRGDVLATIAQPILFERVKSLELALAEAQQSLSSTARTSETSTGLQIGAIEQRHSALNGQLAELREEQQITIARVKDAEQLQQKGLLTTPQVLELKEKVTGINDQMTNMNVEIKQLNSQEYGVRAQPQKEIEAVQERVNSLSSELAAARAELAQAQTVISPDDGEIIEREVDPGSMVSAAQPLLSVQRSRDNLEVIAYVPSLDAKSMNTGMDAQISPSNIRREEYGFINGRVMYVAQFPSTSAALMRNFANDSLAKSLTLGGPVTEVHATMLNDPATVSGFHWSSSSGPPVQVTSGTICSLKVVVKRERPISLLFPYLTKRFAFSQPLHAH